MIENSRSNKQNGTIAFYDFSFDQSAQEQVASALSMLSSESNLLLPAFILRQMEESILRSIEQLLESPREAPLPAPNARTIRVGIHLADAQSRSKPSARWSFFLVQKRGDSAQPQALFLDLYLYQE